MSYGPAWNPVNLAFNPQAPSLGTAITHAMLHASWFHLAGNLVYLVLFGRALEDRFGPLRFYMIFLASAVAGAYTHLWLTRLLAPQYLSYGVVGASGATSGLLGAYLVRFPYSRIRVAYWIFMPLQGINRAGRTGVPVFFAVIFWVVYQGVYTVLQLGFDAVRTAYSVHIGGFFAGILVAVLLRSVPAARAEHSLVKARRRFEEADWFGARGEYIDYLDRCPWDAAVRAEAARASICLGDHGTARYQYTEAVARLLEAGERGEAEKVFAEAIRVIPGFTLPEALHLDVSYGLERVRKFKTALDAYRNFVARCPRSPDAPFVLLRMAGILERRFTRPADALACFEELVERYPGDTWVDFARSEMDRLRCTWVGRTSGDGI